MSNRSLIILGNNIRALRKAHKYSLRKLAEKVGVYFTTIQQWEKGLKTPRIDHLQKLCDVIGVKLEDLWK